VSKDQTTAVILRQLETLHNRLNEIAPRVMVEAFTLDQIAKQLHVSKDTVKRWTLRGDLPTFQCGNVIRVRRTDLDKFIHKRTKFA
jgi:excisionase family DNA binding protein